MILAAVFAFLIILLGWILFKDRKTFEDEYAELYDYDIEPLEWDEIDEKPEAESCRII